VHRAQSLDVLLLIMLLAFENVIVLRDSVAQSCSNFSLNIGLIDR